MNWIQNAIVLILSAAAIVQAPAAGADGWKAGVAKLEITPKVPMWMGGFASRNKPFEGVRQPIYVRALALEDGTGSSAAIVTFDLLMIDRGMADAIADRCRERFGLGRDRLLLNVSHTHSGPVAGRVLMTMYDLDASQSEIVRQYTENAIDRAVEAVGTAIRAMKPATASFGQSLAGIAVNRRRSPIFAGVPGGPVDSDVPVLCVRNPGGKILAVVVGYACHASALNDYLISNDWQGYALDEIDRAHPGVVSFFLQGCGGDCNAFPRRGEALARDHGKVLAAAVEEVLNGKMAPVAGALRSAFDRVEIPFKHPLTREELQQRLSDPDVHVRVFAKHMLSRLGRADRTEASYPYPILVWRFGGEFTLVALGGEVVVDYALRLKRQYGFDRTWVAGYSNEVMSYIPSRRILDEGGYESDASMIYYGRPGRYDDSVEEIIVGKVAALVERTAGTAP